MSIPLNQSFLRLKTEESWNVVCHNVSTTAFWVCRCTLVYLYDFIFITRTLHCSELQKTFSGTRSCTTDWLFDKVWVHINIQLWNILLYLLIITCFLKVNPYAWKQYLFWWNSRCSWSQVALILNKFNMESVITFGFFIRPLHPYSRPVIEAWIWPYEACLLQQPPMVLTVV